MRQPTPARRGRAQVIKTRRVRPTIQDVTASSPEPGSPTTKPARLRNGRNYGGDPVAENRVQQAVEPVQTGRALRSRTRRYRQQKAATAQQAPKALKKRLVDAIEDGNQVKLTTSKDEAVKPATMSTRPIKLVNIPEKKQKTKTKKRTYRVKKNTESVLAVDRAFKPGGAMNKLLRTVDLSPFAPLPRPGLPRCVQ